MPVFNEYIYKPLPPKDAIRLVVLDPSVDETAPITCRIIEQCTLAPNLDYTAVSYVWGKHEFSRTLEIRCEGDVKYLRITPNLDVLLKGLRAPDKCRHLWVDAVCLNQRDDAEKAQQIPAMGAIYTKATAVDIWLGLEQFMTVKLIKFFRKLSRMPDVNKWKSQWDMAGRIVFLARKFVHHDTQEVLRAIQDFFDQPWFSRRWIIQEACLANDAIVHCGKQTIPLSMLSVAATRFQRLDMSDYHIKVAANLGQQTTSLSMLELLWHFHEAACIDPKDRIAAFLSLGGLDGRQFRLDYTKHWTEMYKELASYTYSLGHNDTSLQLLLHLFEFGPVSREKDSSYPSWVPDWSRSRRRRLPYVARNRSRNLDTYEVYPNSPGFPGKAVVSFHDGSLQIHWNASAFGLRNLRVASAATINACQHTEECKRQQVMSILERLFPSVPIERSGIRALASLLKKISIFRHPDAKREATSRSLGRFQRRLSRNHPDLHRSELLMWLETLESTLEEFCLVELESPEETSGSCRVYGIGPELMQVGDAVIPLWSLDDDDSKSALQIGSEEGDMQLSTMLAVRCVEEQPSGKLVEGSPVPAGRIIGPMTCITWTEGATRTKNMPGTLLRNATDHEQWSSMRIV